MDWFEGHPRARGDFESPRLSQTVEPPKGNVWAADRQKTVVIMASYLIPYHHSKKKDKRWGNETSGNKETTARRAQQHSITPLYCSQPAAVAGRSPAALYIFICIPSFAVCVVYVLKMGLTRCSFPFSLFSKSQKGRKKLSPPVNFQANIEAHYSHYNNTRLVSHIGTVPPQTENRLMSQLSDFLPYNSFPCCIGLYSIVVTICWCDYY
jgi:hypothetical protein